MLMRHRLWRLIPKKAAPVLKLIVSGLLRPRIDIAFLPWVWCNYRCPYCSPTFYGGLKDTGITGRQWAEFFRSIRRSAISMSGGEPVLYAGFREMIRGMPRKHWLSLVTNLSYDPRSYEEEFKRFDSIVMSFHPHTVLKTTSLERWLDKAEFVAELAPTHSINIVAFPDQIDATRDYLKAIEQRGLNPHIDPYISRTSDYTDEEKRRVVELRDLAGVTNKTRRVLGRDIESARLKLCNAGQRYFMLTPTGDYYTCMNGFLSEKLQPHFRMGNVFTDGFHLRKTRIICPIMCSSGCDLDHTKYEYLEEGQ